MSGFLNTITAQAKSQGLKVNASAAKDLTK